MLLQDGPELGVAILAIEGKFGAIAKGNQVELPSLYFNNPARFNSRFIASDPRPGEDTSDDLVGVLRVGFPVKNRVTRGHVNLVPAHFGNGFEASLEELLGAVWHTGWPP